MVALKLRPYQVDLVDRTRKQVTPKRLGGFGVRRVILQSGTGSGKGTMSAFLAQQGWKKGSRVLLLADKRKLVWQFVRDLNKLGVPHGIVMSGDSVHTNASVVVASRDTLIAWMKAGRDIGHFDIIIIDEAHLSLGAGFQWLLAKFPMAYVIGPTATPARGDGRRLDDYWEAMECGVPTSQLIAEGWLLAPEVYHPPELAAARAAGEKISGMAGHPVTQWLAYAKDLPTVAFCQTRAEARELMTMFSDPDFGADIACEYVDGDDDDQTRDAILARLKSGETKVVCCCDLWITGVDLPELACMIAWRKFDSDVQWYQACGRIMRPVLNPTTGLPDPTLKPRCIAEGQRVLTDVGLVPIEKVTTAMKVWDGINFVSHKGSVFQGTKKCITYAGLTATEDHRVWTKTGWMDFGRCRNEVQAIAQTADGGRAVREADRRYRRGGKNGEEQTATHADQMCWLRGRAVELCSQYSLSKGRLPKMRQPQKCPKMALFQMPSGESKMRESQHGPLLRLWRSWHKISLRHPVGNGHMDSGQPRNPSGVAVRPNRQRRTLRTVQSAAFNAEAEHGAHEGQSGELGRKNARLQVQAPGNQVCGLHPEESNQTRTYRRGDNPEVRPEVDQAERRVWDILGAGPLHRFTVEGLLVHNCVILDHSGAAYGRNPAEDVAWSLDAGSTVGERQGELNKNKPKEVNCPNCQQMVRGGKACPKCSHPLGAVKQKTSSGAASDVYEATDEMLTLMTPAQAKAKAKAEKAEQKQRTEEEKAAKKKAAFERRVLKAWDWAVAKALNGNYAAGHIVQTFKAQMKGDLPPWAYREILEPHGLPPADEYWKWKLKASEVFNNRPATPEAA